MADALLWALICCVFHARSHSSIHVPSMQTSCLLCRPRAFYADLLVFFVLILDAPPSSREGLQLTLQLRGAQEHAGSFFQTAPLRTLDIAIVILLLACNELHATSFPTTHTLNTVGSAYLYGPRDRTACTGANPGHSPSQL